MDDLLDLDAMFAVAAQEVEQRKADSNTKGNKDGSELPQVQSGMFVRIEFKKGSLLGESLKELQKMQQNSTTQNMPISSPICAEAQKTLDESDAAIIHALVLCHSVITGTIEVRYYRLDHPYNVQAQNMILLATSEIQSITPLGLILTYRTNLISEAGRKFISQRAIDRRYPMRKLINPTASTLGQDLFLFLHVITKNVAWTGTNIIISSKFCISPPYDVDSITGWNSHAQQAVMGVDVTYVKGLLARFEHEQNLKQEAIQFEKEQERLKKEEEERIEAEKKRQEEEEERRRKEKGWKSITKGKK